MVKPKKNMIGEKVTDIGLAFNEVNKDEIATDIAESSTPPTANTETAPTTKETEEIKQMTLEKEVKIQAENIETNTNPGFNLVLDIKGEPDIKKQKMYNLKLGNIKKIKELSMTTGLSESAIVDMLIEEGMKFIKVNK